MVSWAPRQSLAVCALCAILLVFVTVVPASAADNNMPGPSAASMAFDAVLVRPLSAVATVLGTGLFVVSLPFSLLGHNTHSASKRLVAEPFKYTFVRPLGDFDAAAAGENNNR